MLSDRVVPSETAVMSVDEIASDVESVIAGMSELVMLDCSASPPSVTTGASATRM